MQQLSEAMEFPMEYHHTPNRDTQKQQQPSNLMESPNKDQETMFRFYKGLQSIRGRLADGQIDCVARCREVHASRYSREFHKFFLEYRFGYFLEQFPLFQDHKFMKKLSEVYFTMADIHRVTEYAKAMGVDPEEEYSYKHSDMQLENCYEYFLTILFERWEFIAEKWMRPEKTWAPGFLDMDPYDGERVVL